MRLLSQVSEFFPGSLLQPGPTLRPTSLLSAFYRSFWLQLAVLCVGPGTQLLTCTQSKSGLGSQLLSSHFQREPWAKVLLKFKSIHNLLLWAGGHVVG